VTHSLLTQIINTTYLLCNKKEEAKHEIHSNNLKEFSSDIAENTNSLLKRPESHLSVGKLPFIVRFV